MLNKTNPHDRPIRMDMSVLADNKAELVRRLRAQADLIESGRIGDVGRAGCGGNGDDTEYLISGLGPASA